MIVACVYRTGGIYTREWVSALRRALGRWMPTGYRFVCLTDDLSVEPYWRIPLVHNWPGWFSKVELFRPGLFVGPVLYMDLDTLPVGDLSDIAGYRGPFAMLTDFYREQRRAVASGVMAWTPGPHTEAIYEAFVREPMLNGRSDYWYAKHAPDPDRLQELFPGQIVSFKKHARTGPPRNARLVCGHGKPRFSSPAAGWAHEEWRSWATRPKP